MDHEYSIVGDQDSKSRRKAVRLGVVFCQIGGSARKFGKTNKNSPYLPYVKRHFPKFLTLLVCTLGFSLTYAQSVVQPKQLDYSTMGILYQKEKVFEIRPHTNGGAISMQFGKIKTFYKTNFHQFDIGYIKHPKEFRQSVTFNSSNPFARTSNSFTYGKQNNFMVLRGGVGKKVYLSEKAKRKGVAAGVSYEVGPSIGLLVPYYLKLSRLEENGFQDYVSTERYSESNKDVFLDNSKIIGPASFFHGFGHLTAMPGLHGRLGGHFSVGAFDKYVKAFEMGVMVDAYFEPVPIMIVENNSPVFINAYLSFQIGKRQ